MENIDDKIQFVINKTINEQYNVVIKHLEDNVFILSPAGKFQAWILTSTIFIYILRKYDIINNQNIMTYTRHIREISAVKYFRLMNESKSYKIKSIGSDFLDNLLMEGNKALNIDKIDSIADCVKNDNFYKEAVEVSISHFYVELDELFNSFITFQKTKKGLIRPLNIFTNLYVFPFFNILVPNDEKEKLISKIYFDIQNESFLSYILEDFITSPFKIYNEILDLINKDKRFIDFLKISIQ
ncbi:hypothetical protein C3L50_06955 [Flavobacterium alvei]|uniref:Uncharacterized protein n=1 Tax=Flavobacterium alvei TaxID=2080416 RepID=A0A2S5ACZ2_9FLAO|nr:hypothetical protein [Flavobacterium alvei]POY40376.1 hypothetical protein C3L50_06955 [Flavobacterium alvei]